MVRREALISGRNTYCMRKLWSRTTSNNDYSVGRECCRSRLSAEYRCPQGLLSQPLSP